MAEQSRDGEDAPTESVDSAVEPGAHPEAALERENADTALGANGADAPTGTAARVLGRFEPLWMRVRGFATRRCIVVSVGTASALAFLVAAVLVSAPNSGSEVTLVLDGPSRFHELPKLMTDIRPGRKRQHFVSVEMVVETDASGTELLASHETEVLDALQALLRDYDRADLAGRVGAQRLRADVTHVVNRILAPARARSVLFRQLIVD